MQDQFKIKNIHVDDSYRHILAINRNLEKLRDTYKDEPEKTKNRNDGYLWDVLNFRIQLNKKNYPMAWDRLLTTATWIKNIGIELKVLNVGIGPCDLEKMLLENANKYEWYGLDISQKSVNRAISTFPNAFFRVGDITNKTKYLSGMFDIVLVLEVLEHISPNKILKVLTEINRITKIGGYLIVSIPLNESIEEIKNNINPNAHVRVYTTELIKTELEMNNYKVIKLKYFYAFPNKYFLKTLISNIYHIRKPNNLLIKAQKIK